MTPSERERERETGGQILPEIFERHERGVFWLKSNSKGDAAKHSSSNRIWFKKVVVGIVKVEGRISIGEHWTSQCHQQILLVIFFFFLWSKWVLSASDVIQLKLQLKLASPIKLGHIFLKMGLFHLFLSFQHTHYKFYNKYICEKCPSGIQCQDSNTRLLEHESPPITTRPGLPP